MIIIIRMKINKRLTCLEILILFLVGTLVESSEKLDKGKKHNVRTSVCV